MNQLAAAAEAKLDQFSGQNIANTLNSYAKLEHCPTSLLPATVTAAMSKLQDFNAQVWLLGCEAGAEFCNLQM